MAVKYMRHHQPKGMVGDSAKALHGTPIPAAIVQTTVKVPITLSYNANVSNLSDNGTSMDSKDEHILNKSRYLQF